MRARAAEMSPVSQGDIVGGKYRVERVLGAGGMGVVVAAKHVELGQDVALKFILPGALTGKDALERFMREARAAVLLKSEHVARVFDVGRDAEGRPYIVLELLDGHDLARLHADQGLLPVPDVIEYVLQACEALAEAHALGIVHRDLKPHNLFLTRRANGAPLVKVLDFGIAKAVGATALGQMALTDSSAVIGSPLYMAPEQMRSARAADARSDIWALGVILYELLSGKLPFDGETVTEVCLKVATEEAVALAAARPSLPAPLADAVMKCLAKSPADRWQTVADLATVLEPFAEDARRVAMTRAWRHVVAGSSERDLARARTSPSGDLGASSSGGVRGAAFETAPTMASDPPPGKPVRGESGRPGVSSHSAASIDMAVPMVDAPKGAAQSGSSRKGLWFAGGAVALGIAGLTLGGVLRLQLDENGLRVEPASSSPAAASSPSAPAESGPPIPPSAASTPEPPPIAVTSPRALPNATPEAPEVALAAPVPAKVKSSNIGKASKTTDSASAASAKPATSAPPTTPTIAPANGAPILE